MGAFETALDMGREGEAEILQYLQTAGCDVTDVSDDPAYQKKDIDFLLRVNDTTYALEVKTDTKAAYTGNILVEEKMHRPTGTKLGWAYYCEADVLVYYLRNVGIAYFLDWAKTKALLLSGIGRHCVFRNPVDMGTMGEGCLLSIENELEPNRTILRKQQIV